MDNEKLDKVLNDLQEIKITQAIHTEKLSELTKNRIETEKRLKPIEDKINTHDKYVFGTIIACSIVLTLIKLKIF